MQIGAARIPRRLRFTRQLEPGALREIGDGVEKLHLFVLHEKTDDGAMRTAAEAVKELLVGAYREGGGLFIVERAARLVLAAGLLERYACADDLDDIRTCDEFVEKRFWNSSGHGPVAIN